MALPVGMTGVHQQPLRSARVDRAEGRGGEGHEQSGMPADRPGDALAASQPGGQELEAVGLIGGRAGGAHGRSAVAAGLQQGGVRLPVGRVHGPDLARRGVGVLDPAAQPHRMRAVAGRGDLLGPPLITSAGLVNDLLENARQQLPDLDGLAHPVPSSCITQWSLGSGGQYSCVGWRCSSKRYRASHLLPLAGSNSRQV